MLLSVTLNVITPASSLTLTSSITILGTPSSSTIIVLSGSVFTSTLSKPPPSVVPVSATLYSSNPSTTSSFRVSTVKSTLVAPVGMVTVMVVGTISPLSVVLCPTCTSIFMGTRTGSSTLTVYVALSPSMTFVSPLRVTLTVSSVGSVPGVVLSVIVVITVSSAIVVASNPPPSTLEIITRYSSSPSA